MDPETPKEPVKGWPMPSAGLPPASTSYPYPPGTSGNADQQAIRYPHPSAPPMESDNGGPKEVRPPIAEGGKFDQNGACDIETREASMQEKYPQTSTGPGEPYLQLPPQQQQSVPPQASQQNPYHSIQRTHEEERNDRVSSTATDPAANGRSSMRRVAIKVEEKSLLEAYILWFPLGIIGLHQFYLGRVGMGFLYFFTFGLFGIGWLSDMCRLPYLVRQINEKRRRDAQRGYILYAGAYEELTNRSVCSAYLFWLPPVGLFGGHHYYLGRIGYGVAYSLTLGIFGFGWLIDFCRIWVLTKRTNEDIKTLRSGRPLATNPGERMHLDDAYCLAFPLGFLGLHHFYMRRWGFGIVYLLTLGCMGFGFIVDLFRLPCLLNRTKRELATGDKKFHVDDAYTLWFPLGVLGLHHFYLHRWVWAIAYFLTMGFFGIGWIIDLFRIPFLVKAANERRNTKLLLENEILHGREEQHNYDGNRSSVVNITTNQSATYGAITPAPEQSNIAVYAFPLDTHGHPIWTEGVPWDDDGSRETFQSQFHPGGVVNQHPSEPPPPYSQY